VAKQTPIEYSLGTSEKQKLFENVEFDEEGRYIVMHHFGALKYYKFNAFFLLMFLAVSYYNYR